MTTSPVPSPIESAPKTPYNSAGCFSEANLAAVTRRCETFGIKSFVLGAETQAGQYSIHFSNVTMDAAMKIFLQGIAQSVEIDRQLHPEKSESYHSAMKHFVVDIAEAVKKLNSKTSML